MPVCICKSSAEAASQTSESEGRRLHRTPYVQGSPRTDIRILCTDLMALNAFINTMLIWTVTSLNCAEFTNNSDLSMMPSDAKCGLCWTPVGGSAGWAGRVVAMAMCRDAPCFAGLHQLHQLETRPRRGNAHPCATHTADTACTRSSRYFVCVCVCSHPSNLLITHASGLGYISNSSRNNLKQIHKTDNPESLHSTHKWIFPVVLWLISVK